MRTSHRGQTENWLLLKCFNGKIWPLRCFSRKIDSFYPCVTNKKARNTLVILKKWQTSVLCVCKKGLGKVKNRNTLVFISNAIDHVEKCSFAPTAPDRSHWRSLWHLALRHLTVWRSVHFQTPVLSVERQGPPRLSIREGGREREGGGGSGTLSSGWLPQRMDVHPTIPLVKKRTLEVCSLPDICPQRGEAGPPRLSIRERERERGQRRSVVRSPSTEDGCTSNPLPGEEKFPV